MSVPSADAAGNIATMKPPPPPRELRPDQVREVSSDHQAAVVYVKPYFVDSSSLYGQCN